MCTISGFHFSQVSWAYKSSFDEDQKSFVKVLLTQVSNLFSFDIVSPNDDGVRDVEPRCGLPKGKTVAIDEDFWYVLIIEYGFGNQP